jgi:hypothetical protein
MGTRLMNNELARMWKDVLGRHSPDFLKTMQNRTDNQCTAHNRAGHLFNEKSEALQINTPWLQSARKLYQPSDSRIGEVTANFCG